MKTGYFVEYVIRPVKKIKFGGLLNSGELSARTPKDLQAQMKWLTKTVRVMHRGASEVRYGKFFKVAQIKKPFK